MEDEEFTYFMLPIPFPLFCSLFILGSETPLKVLNHHFLDFFEFVISRAAFPIWNQTVIWLQYNLLLGKREDHVKGFPSLCSSSIDWQSHDSH